MADEHQRAAAAGQFAFQPFDGREIEMVGRLVEQQDVGLEGASTRASAARRASPPEEVRRVFVAGEAELFQQIVRLIDDRRRAPRPAST